MLIQDFVTLVHLSLVQPPRTTEPDEAIERPAETSSVETAACRTTGDASQRTEDSLQAAAAG